jgi:hypothetical protein
MNSMKSRLVRIAVVASLAIALLLGAAPAFAGPGTPVYRFYNNTNGTHFYTASYEEMLDVQSKWPAVFAYEGVSFYVDYMLESTAVEPSISFSSVPLYRFYNVKSKSHFYTISAEERDAIKAKWPTVYTYEGVAFHVFADNEYGDFAPVYRFYNKLNGSHFYTISDDEKALVQSLWGTVYTYEGIAFYARPWMNFR